MDKNNVEITEKAVKKLFSLLTVNSPFSVKETDDIIEITLEGEEENGILIGYHGETLEALQLITSLCVAKQLGSFHRVSIEIGEYKKNRMEYLQSLVNQTKEQVIAEQTAIPIPNLKSWERRHVHMLLANDTEVMTESSGEGRDRMLTIRPKK